MDDSKVRLTRGLASVRHQNGQRCALQYFARRSPEQNLPHTATGVGTHDDHRGTLLGCDAQKPKRDRTVLLTQSERRCANSVASQLVSERQLANEVIIS